MDTNALLKTAQNKIKEVQKKLEGDSKRLEELLATRGSVEANVAIGVGTDADKNKIKKLSAEVVKLKAGIETGAPLINALKKKILSLRSKKEKEDKAEAIKRQNEIETSLNSISVKLIPILKSALKLNEELKGKWSTWNELSSISGKLSADKKVSAGSQDALNMVCKTLLEEWDGKSNEDIYAPSGIYFYRVNILSDNTNIQKTNKMILIR